VGHLEAVQTIEGFVPARLAVRGHFRGFAFNLLPRKRFFQVCVAAAATVSTRLEKEDML